VQLRTGTSGFSYKEWKGAFYPEDLPQARFLAYYAERLDTVEINNTFYRMPKPELLRSWAAEVPEGFTFVLKASRRITHVKRLKEPAEPLAYLWSTAQELGPHLGPILFQLPPNAKRNLERLQAFCADLPDGLRAAFEFRHDSWDDDEVHDVLRAAGAAWCTADADPEEGDEDVPPAVRATADWGYLRLRRADYDAAALDAWVARIRERTWKEVFVFFKHEDAGAGPRLAQAFRERFDA
jgi:uncharacterized protein YecE (DUF72 family)